MKGFSRLKTANLVRIHHNAALERVDGFENLKSLGDDDDTEPALVVVENGDRGITMTAFGTLERGGWAALQRLDASALCASALVARDETPCYCGDAADDCFEHADVIRELTKYVDDDDGGLGEAALGLRLTHKTTLRWELWEGSLCMPSP